MFTLLSVVGCHEQKVEDEAAVEQTIVALKKMNFQEAYERAGEIENPTLKRLFRVLTSNKLNGTPITIDTLVSDEIHIRTTKDSILYDILLADLMKETREDYDSVISWNYHNSSRKAKKLNSSVLYNDVLRKHTLNTIYRNKDTVLVKRRLKEYENSCRSPEDYFWFYYLKSGYLYTVKDMLVNRKNLNEDSLGSFRRKEFVSIFKGFKENATSDGMMAYYYHNYGTYQAAMLEDYKGANSSFEKALELYATKPSHFNEQRMASAYYNTGVNLMHNGDYEAALEILIDDLKRDKEKRQIIYHYDNIITSYQGLNDPTNANIFLNKKDSLNNVLDFLKRDKMNWQMENESREKDLKEDIRDLKSLVPVLGFTTIVLIIIFYLFRRYKKKSSILEEEKSETLQKLDELKRLVIKNHIVLKDKTKVYISDLMYIKSDGHYLKVFTSEGKDHFVRGKLSQIKEELPPNFVQCHRSYIVNANFIKQINKDYLVLIDRTELPLSRSFKKGFKEQF